MASNKIVIEVQLDDSGSFKLVEQQAKKAAKATDDLGKSRNRYNKGEKGVIGATSNGTKAFSKMRDSMTGSTGLVSAYAVLASNVFAATAAFNAFRRAAQIQQLESGLVAVGAAAGSNLRDVSNGLRRITGEALSAEQAMRATALATASGFRTDQLQDLSRVAKGASLALGRDMGDAFDRLVRGTAKVEPEILDELGIFVRLDDAVTAYAASLGVAESSLTQYDRSQAFLNATLEQGLEKYQDLSQQIDPNPYDQLSAALADLQKNFLGFFNNFAGLSSAVSFASRNLGSLAAVATTLGAAVTSTVAPGLLRMAESSAESAEGLFQARSEMAKTLTQGKGLPPLFSTLSEKLADGSATTKDFSSAHASLLGKLGANQRAINAFEAAMAKNNDTSAESVAELEKLKGVKADLTKRISGLKDLQASQTDASIAASRASAVANATNISLFDSFKDLGQAHKEDTIRTKEGAEQKRGFGKALHNLGPAARTAGAGLKVVGAAFFTFLPYIGLIISGVSILYGIMKEKFFPEDIVKERIEEATESFKQFQEITTSFNNSTAEGNVRLVNSYIAYAGILDQLIGKLKELKGLNDAEQVTALTNIKNQQEAKRLELKNLQQRKESNKSLGKRGASLNIVVDKDIAIVRAELEDLNKQVLQANKKARQANLATFKEVTEGFVTQFKTQRDLALESSRENPFGLAMAERHLREVELVLAGVANKTELSDSEFQRLMVTLQNLGREPQAIRNAFKNVDDAVANTNGAITKLTTSVKKPFQDVEDGVENVIKLAADLEVKAAQGNTFNLLDPASFAEGKEYQALLKQFNNDLKNLKIPDRFKDDNVTLVDAAKAYLAEIHRIQKSLADLKTKVAETEVASKRMVEITKGITGTQVDRDRAANAARSAQILLLQEEINGLQTVTGLKGEQIDNTEEIAKKQAQIAKLALSQKDLDEARLVDQIALTAETAKQNSLKAEQVQNDLKILKMQDALSGGRTTPREEFEQKVAAAQAAIKAAQNELNLVNARAELEEALFILRAGGAENIDAAEKVVLEKLRAQLALTRQIAEEKVRGAKIDAANVSVGAVAAARNAGAEDMRGSGIDTGLRSAVQTGLDNVSLAGAAANSAQETATQAQADFDQGLINEEHLAVAQNALAQAQANVKTASAEMIAGVLDSQAQALAKLGPEGEIAAAMATFGADMVMNMDAFANAGESTADRLAAGFQMAASAIGGIGQIMAAQSRQAIGEIDNQIAAEKKRDGKSKESVAKLKALEKKKEAMKRKEFEQNKKMQMAQVVANTAAAIMGVWSGVKDPYVGPALAAAQTALIAGLGVAQLAVIAGTSYQGGGSIDQGGGVSSVSMGQRRTTTDLARSQSARGELAYFRGEAGSGGPENFRNAFSGYRNRAGGGNTAFMVGEQGPEMFVPETPGTIVPNDEVQQAAPTNVNFSINAVDAAGVEDLLIRQQGNIIGMIREAANSYGQDFVETVDTSVFNDTTSGVSRY